MKAPHDRSATWVEVWLIITPRTVCSAQIGHHIIPSMCAVPLLLKSRNSVENLFSFLRRDPKIAEEDNGRSEGGAQGEAAGRGEAWTWTEPFVLLFAHCLLELIVISLPQNQTGMGEMLYALAEIRL